MKNQSDWMKDLFGYSLMGFNCMSTIFGNLKLLLMLLHRVSSKIAKPEKIASHHMQSITGSMASCHIRITDLWQFVLSP